MQHEMLSHVQGISDDLTVNRTLPNSQGACTRQRAIRKPGNSSLSKRSSEVGWALVAEGEEKRSWRQRRSWVCLWCYRAWEVGGGRFEPFVFPHKPISLGQKKPELMGKTRGWRGDIACPNSVLQEITSNERLLVIYELHFSHYLRQKDWLTPLFKTPSSHGNASSSLRCKVIGFRKLMKIIEM